MKKIIVATHIILHILSYCVRFHVNSTVVNPYNATTNGWRNKVLNDLKRLKLR